MFHSEANRIAFGRPDPNRKRDTRILTLEDNDASIGITVFQDLFDGQCHEFRRLVLGDWFHG
jgi:hypothetical protein